MVVPAVAAASAAGLGWAVPPQRLVSGAPWDGSLVLVAVAVAAWLCVAWLGAVLAFGVLAGLPGRAGWLAGRCGSAITPAVLRRLLCLTAATAVGGVLSGAGPAAAATGAGSGAARLPSLDWPGLPGRAPVAAAPRGSGGLLPKDPAAALGGVRGDGVQGDGVQGDGVQGGRAQGGRAQGGRAQGDGVHRAGRSGGARAAGSPASTPLPGLDWPGAGPSGHAGRPASAHRAAGAAGTSPPARVGQRRRGTPAGGQPQRAEVVVRPGDTLWAIAARHLGPEATPAEIADAWPRWYAANRAVIGPDAGLIYPGEVLSVPPPH